MPSLDNNKAKWCIYASMNWFITGYSNEWLDISLQEIFHLPERVNTLKIDPTLYDHGNSVYRSFSKNRLFTSIWLRHFCAPYEP